MKAFNKTSHVIHIEGITLPAAEDGKPSETEVKADFKKAIEKSEFLKSFIKGKITFSDDKEQEVKADDQAPADDQEPTVKAPAKRAAK